MDYVEPIGYGAKISCLRSYGRASVALRSSLATPHGNVRCLVLDISIGGARVVTDQTIEIGEALWLSLHKVKVFGSVQWVRGKEIGVKFEEKLPKALVLSLRGDNVDPKALEEVEAMLVAQDWVVGTPSVRPKSMRIADVLGAPNKGASGTDRVNVARRPQRALASRKADRTSTGVDRRVLLIFLSAAAIGSMAGIASFMLR